MPELKRAGRLTSDVVVRRTHPIYKKLAAIRRLLEKKYQRAVPWPEVMESLVTGSWRGVR